MSANYDLARFVRAQAGCYGQALAELQTGEKRTHWMWYVFPQILGLGLSENARLYALSGLGETKAYLDHELLGPRLRECTQAILGHAGQRSAVDILGPIDTLKFRSSMTLFERAAPEEALFGNALNAFFDGARDAATIEKLDA